MKILAIIPARSGSKGIKNKNLQKIIGNKSLIEHTYDIAKKSKIFDKIIVSTDSNAYKNYLQQKKIPIEYLRPKKLSKDYVSDLEVIKYELKRYEKFYKTSFQYICLLQPTSPLRKISHLSECLKKLKNKKLDAIWTVTKISSKFNPIKILKIKNNLLHYNDRNGSKFISRQLLENCYIRNGVAYFISKKSILEKNTILPKKTGYVVIKDKLVNIDTLNELKEARKYLNI